MKKYFLFGSRLCHGCEKRISKSEYLRNNGLCNECYAAKVQRARERTNAEYQSNFDKIQKILSDRGVDLREDGTMFGYNWEADLLIIQLDGDLKIHLKEDDKTKERY